MKIVIDAFGGDNAPKEIVKGAVEFLKANKNNELEICLCGDESKIQNELRELNYDGKQIKIVHAPDIITNDDVPTKAIKEKTNSSLAQSFEILKHDEDCIGLISAGSTGAILAGGFLRIGRIKGVSRPALAPFMPTKVGGQVLLIDCGANMDCKPEYLEQFAVMGSAYLNLFGKKKPRVALLNVGTEDHKGDTRSKEAFALLKENKHINFVGNMEARDLLTGDYDLVVTDGFAGNVLLKSAEGAIKSLLKVMKTEIKSHFASKIGALFMKKTFKNIKKKFNYSEQGGAVLLGCKKLVVKAHGSSKSASICECVNQMYNMVKGKLIDKISKNLELSGIGENDWFRK